MKSVIFMINMNLNSVVTRTIISNLVNAHDAASTGVDAGFYTGLSVGAVTFGSEFSNSMDKIKASKRVLELFRKVIADAKRQSSSPKKDEAC